MSSTPHSNAAGNGAALRASDLPPAVVAGAYQTGVLAARSLQRRGVRAVMVDCDPFNPGFRSVYGPARRCPDPDAQPGQWLEFMLALGAQQARKSVLLATSDMFVSAIARFQARLAEHFLISPGAALQGQLADKQTQYELAARFGMPMPVTQRVESEAELAAFAARAMFPCLLKPMHFREWQRFPAGHPLLNQKVAIAADAGELIAHYRSAAAVTPTVMAQEIIEGPDTAKRVYLAYYDAAGRRIAHAMFRELRCTPLGFGPASVSEPVDDPDTDEVCNGFLRRLGYRGMCEIEMKRDTRDGKVKLIEANPRLSGGGDAAPYAGVDLPWIHYLDLIGRPPAPVAPDRRAFKHIVLRADAEAIGAYVGAGLITWRDVLQSYRPPLAFYDLDPRDWRSSLETLYVFGKRLGQSLLRGSGGRPRGTT